VIEVPGLRRRRLLAALTQAQLAERAGLKRLTITRLESGSKAQATTVRKLADALGCSPAELVLSPTFFDWVLQSLTDRANV